MKLLILGGTVFVGRHLVELALSRGHEVTLFNRGRRNPELFPQVEKLRGDRDGDLDALKDRTWDAVIDTCGYVSRVVTDSARLLSDSVGHYTFISSVSVYADLSRPGVDENGRLATTEDPTVEAITAETYGALKVLCEQAVEREMPGRTLIIRPGLIVGPHDPSDRFTYWPHLIARGGEIITPEPASLPTQFIDARDLAAFTLIQVERNTVGAFNAVGPDTPLPFQNLAETCRDVSGSNAEFTWIDGAWLKSRGVDPQSFMFWWIPPEEPEYACAFEVSNSKAVNAGLRLRSPRETVADTLAWERTRPADYELRFGLSRQREAELLREWHEERG